MSARVGSAEAARIAGVSWPTLRRMVAEHGIRHMRVGRRWLFNPERLAADLDAIEDHLAGGGALDAFLDERAEPRRVPA